jgi:hypothetical protein
MPVLDRAARLQQVVALGAIARAVQSGWSTRACNTAKPAG